jgi:ABC-type lipoprotein release transport system permease subunit
MNTLKLILTNLKFYRKEHSLLLIGLVLSTAILTSALIIGDSVKFSLNAIVEKRLGKTQHLIFTQERFFPAQFSKAVSNELNIPAAPVLLLRGMASSDNTEAQIPNVQVCGINADFWKIGNCEMPKLNENEVIINSQTANKLKLNVGDELFIRVEKVSFVTENAPFVPTDNNSSAMRMKVKAIADEHSFGEFNVQSSQITPYTVFFSLKKLSKLSFKGDFANLMLLSENNKTVAEINNALKKCWKIDIVNLKIRTIESQKKWELTSDKVFIEDTILSVLQKNKLKPEPQFTYLINFIRSKNKSTPYSFVSALSHNNNYQLKDNEIIINSWLAEDLGAKVNDTIQLQYFTLESFRKLEEQTTAFIVKYIVEIEGFAADSLLMPAFEGLTGVDKCSDWEAGIPVDYAKIRDKDEAWWKKYRGTPKAFISYYKAVELWGMNFGNSTAIRFDNQVDTILIKQAILNDLQPSNLGFSVIDIKRNAGWSANNAVDFAQLFLGLSFFLILAAFLLSGLLFSMLLVQRKKELGIYRSMGIPQKTVLRIFFGEGMLNASLSSFIGVFVGILLSQLVLIFLNSIWNDIVRTNSVQLFISPLSLIIGFLSNCIIAGIVIYRITRNFFKKQINELNRNIQNLDVKHLIKNKKTSWWIGILSGILIIGLLVFSFQSKLYQNSSIFMLVGFLLLVSLTSWLAFLLLKIRTSQPIAVTAFNLALRNLTFDLKRNLIIICILSIGIFIVISTGANRVDFSRNAANNSSGTGGFAYFIETNLPVNADLSTAEGKGKLGIEGEYVDLEFVQLLKFAADDASCLNLNRIIQPSILGVNPEVLSKRNAFFFVAANTKDATWEMLNQPLANNCIPAVADQTVITWGMGKAVGDSILYTNEAGDSIFLVLVGALESSVFQGNMLVSKQNFGKHFPTISGSKVILADVKDEQKELLKENLESAFRNYGANIQSASERLAMFNSVTNTYLDIFLALGGIALIIGTFGIAILIFRSIQSRTSQYAMMQAIGINRAYIQIILFYEFSIILFSGIISGILSAIVASLPNLFSSNTSVPYALLFSLIILFIINGFLWIFIGTKFSLKKNFSTDLRNE